VKSKIITTLSTSPKTTTSQSSVSGRIQKKGKFWQYYVSSGNRIIYDVIDKPIKVILILFAGSHDDAAVFLRNN